MDLVCLVLSLFQACMLVQIIISWLFFFKIGDALRGVYELLDKVTGPVIRPVRRLLPAMGMFDLSFLVVLVALQIFTSALKCPSLF